MTPQNENLNQKNTGKRSLDLKIDELVPYLSKDFLRFNTDLFVLELRFWQILHREIGDDLSLWPMLESEKFHMEADRRVRKDVYDEFIFMIRPNLAPDQELLPGTGVEDMVAVALKMVDAFERLERNRQMKIRQQMKQLPQEL